LGNGWLCSKAEEKKMKRDNIRTGVIIVCLLGIAVCLILLIPQVRQTIIEITEQFLMRRELKDHAKWHKVLFRISITGGLFWGLILFCFLFKHIINKIQKAVCKYPAYMNNKILKVIRSKYLNYKIFPFKTVVFSNRESAAADDCVHEKQRLKTMKKSHQFLVLLIIYLLTLGIRIYWLTQKNGFHEDEGLSVALSCYNDYMWSINYEFNKEYTGKEVKEISLCDNDSIKNVLGDIYRLWKDNRDSPHTNLYYSLFRLSLAGLKTGDIKLIILRGGILNLVSFTISFIFFFLLMKLFFNNSALLQFSAAACAFLSTATVSNTLFLRPYQIQETMFIVFCYCFFKTFSYKKIFIHEEKLYVSVKLIFLLSLVTAFTLLTGYYAVIFVGLFGLYVIFINFKTKNYAEIGCYIVILCLSLLFAQVFYPRYFTGFISYRGLEAKQTLFTDVYKNIASSITPAVILLQKHFFTYPVITACVLCLILLIYSRRKLLIQAPAVYVFIVSVLYVIIVLFLAPPSLKILRYIMPVFPFFVIFPALIIYSIKSQKLSIIAALLLCAAFSKDVLNQNKIENLYRDKPDLYYFNRDAAVPVFVINNSFWKYADMVPYFNDEQTYYFFDNYDDILLPGYNEFYLVVEKTLEPPDANLAQFETGQEFEMRYFVCKKIRRLLGLPVSET
jgi:hypothetical protein